MDDQRHTPQRAPQRAPQRVAIIGFGYIGSCIGACLAARGFPVVGVEPRIDVVDMVNAGRAPHAEPGLDELIRTGVETGLLRLQPGFDDISACDVLIVTVSTPLQASALRAELSGLRQALESLRPYLRPGHLVILKSTIPPGCTEGMAREALDIDRFDGTVDLAFCPERLAEGQAIRELGSVPVIVSGLTPQAVKRAAAFWGPAFGVETIPVSSPRTAEFVKLADNLWIDTNIALANELAKVCGKLGVDVIEVIHAANSLPKGMHHVNILAPSFGVGGSCLTKDPWFVNDLAESLGVTLKLPAVSRGVNDGMPAHTASLIDAELGGGGKIIGALGLSFKGNTGDVRHTPCGPLLDALLDLGYDVRVFDPLVDPREASTVTRARIVESVEAAIDGAACAAFLAAHQEFRDLPPGRVAELIEPGGLVFDGRMYFTSDKIAAFQSLGLRFKGVGR